MFSLLLLSLALVTIFIILYLYGKTKTKNKCNQPEKVKFYCINLESSHERWKRIQSQALREGIDIIRVPAVDGRLLKIEDSVASGILQENNELSLGQLGCALSHIKTLKIIEREILIYGMLS